MDYDKALWLIKTSFKLKVVKGKEKHLQQPRARKKKHHQQIFDMAAVCYWIFCCFFPSEASIEKPCIQRISLYFIYLFYF